MPVAFLVAERLDDLLQFEVLVHHRPQAVGIDRAHHRLLLGAAAHQHTLQANLPHQRLHQRQLTGHAGKDADQRHMPTDARGNHRLFQRRRATHLDHMVDTTVVGERAHFLAPGRGALVVDQVVGAQGLQALQLGVAGRCGDHGGASQLGKLQGEDRHTTGALHQHRVARLEVVVAHQRTPGGKASGGQGSGFGMAEAFGRQGERGGAGGHLFAGIAVEAVTGHPGKALDIGLAVEPVGEEGADHIVADLELADALAHRNHFAGAIGHGDTPLARAPHAADHGKVMVVEGAGVQAHGDFAGLGGLGLAGADLDLVVAAAGLYVDGLAGHGWVSVSEERMGLSIDRSGPTDLRLAQYLWERACPRRGPRCRHKNQPSITFSARQSAACQSTSSGHGLSGRFTSTVRAPAARPQSRSNR